MHRFAARNLGLAPAGMEASQKYLETCPDAATSGMAKGSKCMQMDWDRLRVAAESEVELADWPTNVKPIYKSKKHYRMLLDKHVAEMSALQEILYASNSYSLLLIFQALDAAGKDGVIKHVMSGVNPQGCDVHSFKHPSVEELDHDFLWRSTCRLPERGRIGIFNRSYYEEVLIVRVHPELLHAENLPGNLAENPNIWSERYRSILDLEAHLHRNGTRIIKFFLHLSWEEQRKRFLKRLEQPEKNWKFSLDDIKERKYWNDYMKAYADCMSGTSTAHAPWYIVPADDKPNARLIVSRIVLDALKALHLSYPQADAKRLRELKALRSRLEKSA